MVKDTIMRRAYRPFRAPCHTQDGLKLSLPVPILRTVKDRNDRDLFGFCINVINDDVGHPDHGPFIGALHPACVPHVGPHPQPVGRLPDAKDHLDGSPRISLLDVFVDVFDIDLCAPPISNTS